MGMSTLYGIKKLKKHSEELKFIKNFQQDTIVDVKLITEAYLSKKSLPKTASKEIEIKRKTFKIKFLESLSLLQNIEYTKFTKKRISMSVTGQNPLIKMLFPNVIIRL